VEEKDPAYLFVGDPSWEQIAEWYKSYSGWQMNPYRFLVSGKLLDNWVGESLYLERHVLQKRSLAGVGSYLRNHFDHGMEFISLEPKVDTLQGVAQELSERFSVPLEIRDKGAPN
jgi:hypothetical protein